MDRASNLPASAACPIAPPVALACVVSAEEERLFLSHAMPAMIELPVNLTWVRTENAPLALERLRDLNPSIIVTGWSTPPLPEAWLSSPACALRYVCHLAGSVRHLVPRRFLERGGIVTNWGDLPSGAVAEHALLLALAALRNLSAWEDIIGQTADGGSHIERLHTRTLFGRTIGIHGFGRVARALVPLLRPFGGIIHAFSAGVPTAQFHAAGVTPCASLDELAARSEIFFECEALTPATAGSVSSEILAALPPRAIFVNVGRGGLVDEPALLRQATSGRIRAALDVVASEPLTRDSAFHRVRGSILSPHIAGPTFDQYPQCARLAVRNLACFLRQEPLPTRLSLEHYDRAT